MTRNARHEKAHGRQTGTSTSTAPPSWSNALGLPWGAQGHTEGDRRGLATDGGVHMSGTSETGSTATEHHEIPDNRLCMQHCQGGAGNRAPTGGKKFLQRSNHLSWLFSPAAGGRRTVQTYRAGPTHLAPTNIATSGTLAHNKSDCANTRCDDKERTPNKPTKRRLTRPHTARTTTADAT